MYVQSAEVIVKYADSVEVVTLVISILTLAIVLISFLMVAGNIYFSFLKKSSVVVEGAAG